MKKTNKLTAMILTCVMAFSVLFGAQNVSAAEFSGTKAEVEALLKECYDNNPAKDKFVYGEGLEWEILNYARSGAVTEAQKKSYCDSVVKALQADGRDSFQYASENAKVVLVLNAMKCDPTNVGGYNLVAPLKDESCASLTGNYLTTVMYALYSCDANVNCPSYVDALLASQDESGGFYDGWSVGPDGTAMIIQALAPYYNKDARVKSAVDAGLTYLVTCMDATTGAITSWGKPNSNSTAQVILALTSLGINPAEDSRFCQNGKNLITALQSFYCGNGMYGWDSPADTENFLASEQSVQAMIAYNRLLNGQTSFYDYSDLRQPAVYKYPVLEGAAQTVDTTKDGTLSIRIDCPIEKFVGVEMDGVMVDPKYYTVKSGSTIVTFTSEYVKTLKAGAHAVTVNFTDGSATVNVEVKDASSTVTAQTVKSPKTGDKFPVAVIAVLLLTLGSAACLKKRSEKK